MGKPTSSTTITKGPMMTPMAMTFGLLNQMIGDSVLAYQKMRFTEVRTGGSGVIPSTVVA